MIASKHVALILTSALTDGAFSLVAWRPFETDEKSLIAASRFALHASSSAWGKHLYNAIRNEDNAVLPTPLLLHDKRIEGATYHHGGDHAHYIIGPIAPSLRVSSLTENERESVMQFARQQTILGNACYGIASGHSKNNITKVSQLEGMDRLGFLGVVVVKPRLYPNTHHRLAHITEKYTALHLLTTGDDYYACALGIQSKMMSPSDQPTTNIDSVSSLKSSVLLFSKHDYDACIARSGYDRVFDTPL